MDEYYRAVEAGTIVDGFIKYGGGGIRQKQSTKDNLKKLNYTVDNIMRLNNSYLPRNNSFCDSKLNDFTSNFVQKKQKYSD